jgi:hypothetical protein
MILSTMPDRVVLGCSTIRVVSKFSSAILADTWTKKIGKGLMFISLNVEPRGKSPRWMRCARSWRSRAFRSRKVRGGYRFLVVDDPDGNQLFFNYPNEIASGKIAIDEALRQ